MNELDPAYDMLANYRFNTKRDPFHNIAVYNKRDDNQDLIWNNLVNLQREWFQAADRIHNL